MWRTIKAPASYAALRLENSASEIVGFASLGGMRRPGIGRMLGATKQPGKRNLHGRSLRRSHEANPNIDSAAHHLLFCSL